MSCYPASPIDCFRYDTLLFHHVDEKAFKATLRRHLEPYVLRLAGVNNGYQWYRLRVEETIIHLDACLWEGSYGKPYSYEEHLTLKGHIFENRYTKPTYRFNVYTSKGEGVAEFYMNGK